MCDSGTIKTINRSLLGQPGSPVMKVARDPPKHDQPNYDNIHRVFQRNWTYYVTFFKILFCFVIYQTFTLLSTMDLKAMCHFYIFKSRGFEAQCLQSEYLKSNIKFLYLIKIV